MELGDKSFSILGGIRNDVLSNILPKNIGEIDSVALCTCICVCVWSLVCEPVLLVCNMNVGRVKWCIIWGFILNKASVLQVLRELNSMDDFSEQYLRILLSALSPVWKPALLGELERT